MRASVGCWTAGGILTPPAFGSNTQVPRGMAKLPLELRVPRRAGEGDDVADVLHAGEVHHHPLQTQPEAGVRRGAELAQLQIPPVILFRQALLPDGGEQDVVALFALAAADDLTDA